ncbi:hypothetical protein niasHS_008529 [Heterodera schachtii]|uniref:Uncharacterized protein n=1 Tax=Heterodera schachtii TaxID=97005 RepID=A0ABD2J6I7_HETSC
MRIYLCLLSLLISVHYATVNEPQNKTNEDDSNLTLPSVKLANNVKKADENDQQKNNRPPNNGIAFVVEGIERSDFGQSLRTSNFQRSRSALGFQNCEDETLPAGAKSSLIKVFYESQRGPSNYEPEAIRVLCWNKTVGGMKNFCACNENGECFVPAEVPTYVEVQPYCEPVAAEAVEGGKTCHVYLELYGGRLKSVDNPTVSYWHPFDSGPFGIRSPYMKVSAVSCEGCGRIRHKAAGEGNKCGGAKFIGDTLDQPMLDEDALFSETKLDGKSTEMAAKRGHQQQEAIKNADNEAKDSSSMKIVISDGKNAEDESKKVISGGKSAVDESKKVISGGKSAVDESKKVISGGKSAVDESKKVISGGKSAVDESKKVISGGKSAVDQSASTMKVISGGKALSCDPSLFTLLLSVPFFLFYFFEMPSILAEFQILSIQTPKF